jgi:hypothetical protein
MAGVSQLTTDAVIEFATKSLKQIKNKYSYVERKLQAVIATKKHSITKIAQIYNISRITLAQWVKH